MQAFIDALKARVVALEAEAKQLLEEGKTEAEAVAAKFAAEFKALVAELENLL
jgi:hypothetical protein